MSQMS